MLLQNKKFIFFICLCSSILSACGFSPVYEIKQNSSNITLPAIEITGLSGHDGNLLKYDLEDEFNPDNRLTQKDFILNASIKMEFLPVLIEPNGKIHRYRIKILSPFELKKKQNLNLIEKGMITRTVSYNVSDSDYSSFIAPQDAIKRGLKEIAHEYRNRFSALFSRLSPKDSSL